MFDHIVFPVSDDVVGPCLTGGALRRSRRDGADHHSAEKLRHLHQEQADSARRGMHEYGVARADQVSASDQEMGCNAL